MAQAKIIDGKHVADELRKGISNRVEALKSNGVIPGLAVVMAGEDPPSQVYVRMKGKACEKLGITEETITLSAETSQDELVHLIEDLNNDDRFHGILVQMPLPDHMNPSTVIQAIDPRKDVDGLHPVNVGKLVLEETGFLPCTPHGILKLLEHYDIDTEGKNAVVIGRSNLVGKPITNLLYQKKPGTGNATVTICHTRTKDLAQHTRRADLLVVAAGAAKAIKADMIKPHAVVVDVGVNRVDDPSSEKGYKLVGDVDFETAQNVADYITPVPGGVGPMTITMLLHNTVWAAEQR
ncbi:MAG TPA: bifunctional methylenetetrahydrofolate dehydrogenase/methenyltetrahydrofolate cyclohydrolase FolD [bacterium]|nr:bifunctional methylenetetrahydrofolate dehydrogenase/methenyltetrahydrofolate cyclohydrolase FolD [bacterium]